MPHILSLLKKKSHTSRKCYFSFTDSTAACRIALPWICSVWLHAHLRQTMTEWQEEGGDRFVSRQTVRQTEAARKHGKGRLTNCFCPLWEGAARHGLVWALTFRRVKSDPRRRKGIRKGDEERVWGMEKEKLTVESHRNIDWKRKQVMGKTTEMTVRSIGWRGKEVKLNCLNCKNKDKWLEGDWQEKADDNKYITKGTISSWKERIVKETQHFHHQQTWVETIGVLHV